MPKLPAPQAMATAALTALVLAIWPSFAMAYVGPGLGLGALGGVFAFVGAIILAIVGFIWYPIKRLIRFVKKSAERPPVD